MKRREFIQSAAGAVMMLGGAGAVRAALSPDPLPVLQKLDVPNTGVSPIEKWATETLHLPPLTPLQRDMYAAVDQHSHVAVTGYRRAGKSVGARVVALYKAIVEHKTVVLFEAFPEMSRNHFYCESGGIHTILDYAEDQGTVIPTHLPPRGFAPPFCRYQLYFDGGGQIIALNPPQGKNYVCGRNYQFMIRAKSLVSAEADYIHYDEWCRIIPCLPGIDEQLLASTPSSSREPTPFRDKLNEGKYYRVHHDIYSRPGIVDAEDPEAAAEAFKARLCDTPVKTAEQQWDQEWMANFPRPRMS